MTLGQLLWSWWGQVWPNLAASAICAVVVWLRVRVHLRQHREELARAHAKTHELLEQLHAKVDASDG